VEAITEIAHKRGALLIVSIAEAVCWDCRAAASGGHHPMEAQSFGVPMGFGGPYCGVIATKEKFVPADAGATGGSDGGQEEARLSS